MDPYLKELVVAYFEGGNAKDKTPETLAKTLEEIEGFYRNVEAKSNR